MVFISKRDETRQIIKRRYATSSLPSIFAFAMILLANIEVTHQFSEKASPPPPPPPSSSSSSHHHHHHHSSSSSVDVDHGEPPAYMIIEAKLNPTKLKGFMTNYASKVPPLITKYGGEYLILGGRHESLEGEWEDTKFVVHKWPNATMAKKFWNSEEYGEIKKGREGTGEFRIMLVEGLEVSDLEEEEEDDDDEGNDEKNLPRPNCEV